MKITAKQIPGKLGFRTTFRHPTRGLLCWGLSTTDKDEADRICRELTEGLTDPSITRTSGRLFGFHKRTNELLFGADVAKRIESKTEQPALDEDDIGSLARRIMGTLERASADKKKDTLVNVLRAFESKRYGELQKQFKDMENKWLATAPRVAELEHELARIRREHNKHVTITAAAAFEAFKSSNDYTHLEVKTQNELSYAVDLFLATLPEKQKLGELRSTHIADWLNVLKKKDGGDLSVVTKAKMKRYLSVFMSAAYSTYDLHENPMDKTRAVKGAALSREEIKAITDESQFHEFLDTLKAIDPYWHAFAATAVLAGPRYAELCWLKLEHVNLEGNYIKIATRRNRENVKGTKTGKERRVPIETTTLRKILADHLVRRQVEQQREGASEGEKSDFVFPTRVPPNAFKPREKTPAGIWSDNRVFQETWEQIAELGRALTYEREYWNYGPREWRHCAGTAMGYSGNDSLRISSWLGNSEDVCKDHYIRASETGKLWAFRW
jgi:site-specific recombinase XerD